jgi:hypothetical protein
MVAPTGKQGGLIQLDMNEFSIFYEKLKIAWVQTCLASKVLRKYAGKNGILSPMAAVAVERIIKSKLEGTSEFPNNWDDVGHHQSQFKFEHGWRPEQYKMTRSLYANIKSIKRDGVWVVGVDRRAVVPQVGFRTYAKNPRTKGKKIKVETYAAWNEFGNKNTPERNLFRSSAAQFIIKYVPELLDLVIKSFARVAKFRAAESYKGKSTGKGDVSNIISSYTLGNRNPDSDFDGEAAENDVKLEVAMGKISGDGSNQIRILKEQDDRETKRPFAKISSGVDWGDLSPEAIKEIQDMMKGY